MAQKDLYPHYHKPVPPGTTHADVYRVLRMFDVRDPAVQHAIKKLLVAGNRGVKPTRKDIEEAIASLQRWLEMEDEEAGVVGGQATFPGIEALLNPRAPKATPSTKQTRIRQRG